jgi:hypothetical protein
MPSQVDDFKAQSRYEISMGPQYGFEPLLRTLCTHVHNSEWYTYFGQFDAIAPIRIFKPYFEHFCIHAHSSEWCTYFEQFDAIAPIRILNLTLNAFASMPTAQNGTLTLNNLLL